MTDETVLGEDAVIPVAVIRHGATDWSVEKRFQGHVDRPLSGTGRKAVSRWCVPARFCDFDWMTSPLLRARETAGLLGLDAKTEPLLAEMHWGAWEGYTPAELRAELGAEAYAHEEAQGLDLRPEGGESPREVQRRVAQWLAEVHTIGRPVGAVAHKGIARALLCLATGWDMTGRPPHKLDWACLHLFGVRQGGDVRIVALNIPLDSGIDP